MSGLSLELRRGLGKWLVLPLAAAGILYGKQVVPVGPAVWPVIVSALAYSVVLIGPIAAGVAAVAGTRSYRRNTGVMEQLSARGPAAAGLSELGALLIWVLVGFAIVLGALYVPAALSATWSGPDGLRTVTTVLGMLLYVVIGYVVGRVIPSRLSPAVVALVLFAGATVLDNSSSGYRWELLLPVNQHFADEFSPLNPVAFRGQLVWYLGLGLLLVAGWALRHSGRSRPGVSAVTAGIVIAGLGAGVVISQNGKYILDGDHPVWTCRGAQPQICLHPALADARQQVSAALIPVVDRLAGTPFQVRRAEQRPRGVGSTPTPGAVGFALDDTRPASLTLAGRELAVNALGDQDTCFAADATSDGYELAQLVGAWAAGDPSLYTPTTAAGTAARRWFLGLSPALRRRWLTEHQAAVRACTLTYSAFR